MSTTCRCCDAKCFWYVWGRRVEFFTVMAEFREKLVRLGQPLPFKVKVVQRTILILVPHSEGGVVV